MKNFVEPEDILTVAAPAAVASGQPVQIGSLFGVAVNSAAQGEPLPLLTTGVAELPKVSGEAHAVGDRLYFDAASGWLTQDGTGGRLLVGVCVEAAGAGALKARVRLVLSLATGPAT